MNERKIKTKHSSLFEIVISLPFDRKSFDLKALQPDCF